MQVFLDVVGFLVAKFPPLCSKIIHLYSLLLFFITTNGSKYSNDVNCFRFVQKEYSECSEKY